MNAAEGKPRTVEVMGLVQPGRVFGVRAKDEIQVINRSRWPISVVLSTDKMGRQLAAGCLELGVGAAGGAGKFQFTLQNKQQNHQSKAIEAGGSTFFTARDTRNYMTAMRLRSTGKYALFRIDVEIEKGSIWTATDSSVMVECPEVEQSLGNQLLGLPAPGNDPPPPPSVEKRKQEHVVEELQQDAPSAKRQKMSIDDLIQGIRGLGSADRAEFGRRLFAEIKF
jgi:hypothetical protein